jgi:hypothetical protein
MTRTLKAEVLAHKGARNGAVGIVNEAHLVKILCRWGGAVEAKRILKEGRKGAGLAIHTWLHKA